MNTGPLRSLMIGRPFPFRSGALFHSARRFKPASTLGEPEDTVVRVEVESCGLSKGRTQCRLHVLVEAGQVAELVLHGSEELLRCQLPVREVMDKGFVETALPRVDTAKQFLAAQNVKLVHVEDHLADPVRRAPSWCECGACAPTMPMQIDVQDFYFRQLVFGYTKNCGLHHQ